MNQNSTSAVGPEASGSKTAALASASGRSYVFLITYLVALSAFGSFVNDMYIPTLPEMTRFFGCSTSTVQLGLTSGMIGLGVGQILMGPLSDRYGHKTILFVSMAIFIIGAIVAPLVGLGDIQRSSAIVFGAMAVLILICGYGTRRIAPDLK